MEWLAKIGIKLYNPNGSFRSLYEVLNELSNVWDNLSQKEKDKITFNFYDELADEESMLNDLLDDSIKKL